MSDRDPPRRILHLDIDAFLASIEQIVEPALVGRPVVVGYGVVCSRSYEAKARGIATAMAMREARRLCKDLVVRDGDSRLAEKFRARVAAILALWSPLVEVASLDDIYADLTATPALCELGSATAIAQQIRVQVREQTGLSVSQGIGVNKTIARMATRHGKPAGIVEIVPGDERAFLASHALRDLPGIGATTATLLSSWNLHTVGDLAALDERVLEKALGARGLAIARKARGVDDDPVRPTPPELSISRETSFAETLDHAFLRGIASYLVDRATAELRRRGKRARILRVRVRSSDGIELEKQRALALATDRTDLLQTLLHELIAGVLERRVLVRFVGVTLTGLEGQVLRQGQLFDQEDQRRRALFTAVDRVRTRHGFRSSGSAVRQCCSRACRSRARASCCGHRP